MHELKIMSLFYNILGNFLSSLTLSIKWERGFSLGITTSNMQRAISVFIVIVIIVTLEDFYHIG